MQKNVKILIYKRCTGWFVRLHKQTTGKKRQTERKYVCLIIAQVLGPPLIGTWTYLFSSLCSVSYADTQSQTAKTKSHQKICFKKGVKNQIKYFVRNQAMPRHFYTKNSKLDIKLTTAIRYSLKLAAT